MRLLMKWKRTFSGVFIYLTLLSCSSIVEPENIALPPNEWENKIDYSRPQKYLMNGTDTSMPDEMWNTIRTQFSAVTLEGLIIDIHKWKSKTFKNENAGGKYIGKNSVENIIDTKVLTGCHDHGLLMASILRMCGYPVIMVDTAEINWMDQYRHGTAYGVSGHVFLEVYDGEKWILLNSTNPQLIEKYDYLNPVIPISLIYGSDGYYTVLKGIDPHDYNVGSNEDLTTKLKKMAMEIDITKLVLPNYEIKILSKQ